MDHGNVAHVLAGGYRVMDPNPGVAGNCTLARTRLNPRRMEAKPCLLEMKVRRCTLNRHRFRWDVQEVEGRVVDSALSSYATQAEATRAGNAAARAIRVNRFGRRTSR